VNGIIARFWLSNFTEWRRHFELVTDGDPKSAPENILNFGLPQFTRPKDAPCVWACWMFHFKQVLDPKIVSGRLSSSSVEPRRNG
jgi:hypothetical protein